MYRFALSGRWLVGHVVVLSAAAVMVVLGLWQLDRLEQRKDFNAALRRAASLPPVPVSQVDAEAARRSPYRPVTATGRYDHASEVLVGYRSHEGLPGFWVLTPLVDDGGTAVVVNRGWVPVAVGERWQRQPASAAPVTVEGVARSFDGGGRVTRVSGSPLPLLTRVDLDALRRLVPHPVWPVYLQVVPAEGTGGSYPTPVGLPEPGEGPHLSYALQWFSFATLALLTWGALIRSAARRERRAARPPDAAPTESDLLASGR